MKLLYTLAYVILPVLINAQAGNTASTTNTPGSAPKINALVHTKLDVKFDYDKQWLYGKEWVTLHPHINQTDSLSLDAKGMDIKEISLVKGNTKISFTI
jgi:aminopeptidase N